MNAPYRINAEDLAYWYFRLNGCLTIRNFVVHPDKGINQQTEIDIIAVRFPYRAELRRPMRDDKAVFNNQTRIRIILAEVTIRTCKLNDTWLDQEKGNMQRVLRAVGTFPIDMIDHVSECLYEQRFYRDPHFHISLFCLGKRVNPEIRRDYPDVPQLEWNHVLRFIYERFTTHRNVKLSHPQWDEVGSALWYLAMLHSNADDFTRAIEIHS